MSTDERSRDSDRSTLKRYYFSLPRTYPEGALANTDLSGSDLRDTNLRGANLARARLFNANLKGAIVEDIQLCSARSLQNAILPKDQSPLVSNSLATSK